ncbi:hypothetical protein [Kitasatospora sp. NPDC088346]|uniref:hypothetical protein n=1 Tax=Kitasatospora sp. NPDC088346 TaxID=3364073 RepID=UPI0038173103
MADGHSFTLTIVLPDADVRAITAYFTGVDSGVADDLAVSRAGAEALRAAEQAVTALLRRVADYRPLAASVTVQNPTTDPNPVVPLTGPADPS